MKTIERRAGRESSTIRRIGENVAYGTGVIGIIIGGINFAVARNLDSIMTNNQAQIRDIQDEQRYAKLEGKSSTGKLQEKVDALKSTQGDLKDDRDYSDRLAKDSIVLAVTGIIFLASGVLKRRVNQ